MLGAIATRRSRLIGRQTTNTKHTASVCTSTGAIDTGERDGADKLSTASGDKHSIARQLQVTCTTATASNHDRGRIPIAATRSEKQAGQSAAAATMRAAGTVSVGPSGANHNKIRSTDQLCQSSAGQLHTGSTTAGNVTPLTVGAAKASAAGAAQKDVGDCGAV